MPLRSEAGGAAGLPQPGAASTAGGRRRALRAQVEPSLQNDLAHIQRRETQLWTLTVLLLVIFLGAVVASFYLLASRAPLVLSLGRTSTLGAAAGLVVLTTLFCLYVFNSRTNFGRMRTLLSAQALRDPLTGLLNRQSFGERIEAEVARADRAGGLVAFLLCDLDHFKRVNDSRGHHVGDRVLRAVGERLEQMTRGSDLVFRWGGDEFLVVLSLTSRDGVRIAASRIRRALLKLNGEHDVDIDLSIGAALYPEHGRRFEELLQLADRALYIAKRGGGKVHIGEEQLPISREAVRLVFQPVVDSQSQEVLGYEALSRDPRGELEIEELFRRYRAVGQLESLKELIFGLQLEKAAQLGLPRVFVNVDLDLLEQIEVPAKPAAVEVVLEISERAVLTDVDRHIRVAGRWRRKGFKFAIDDFGSGFISLPFIAQLVPDFIKMNRSTILEAAQSDEFSNFLRDMLVAMRNYSPEGVIAEGIETEQELAAARRLGVHQVQGYLTGRPDSLD